MATPRIRTPAPKLAQDLLEDFAKGNRSGVREELLAMPRHRQAAVLGYMFAWRDRPDCQALFQWLTGFDD